MPCYAYYVFHVCVKQPRRQLIVVRPQIAKIVSITKFILIALTFFCRFGELIRKLWNPRNFKVRCPVVCQIARDHFDTDIILAREIQCSFK